MIKEINRDPIFLAQKSIDATENDKYIITDLVDTLKFHSNECLGLAANMIGELKRFIVVSTPSKLLVMVNPNITNKIGSYNATEFCLSHDESHTCKRYKEIEVEFLDQDFQKRKKCFKGRTAQVIQHEIDHCNGVIV